MAIMKTQSEFFSRFVSLHIGTEKIVKLRRLLINKFLNKPGNPDSAGMEVVGSISEGLNTTGSDIDLLYVVHDLLAYERGDQTNNFIPDVEYDSLMDNIHPGYVMLSEFCSSKWINNYMNVLCNIFTKNYFDSKQHGPALMKSTPGVAIDLDEIFSIKSKSWPKIAMEWIYRKRQFGWPSQEMIYSIVKQGCHIVPVGSSRNHAEDEDWRLSFCTAEKQLVATFNHTQISVYGVLKLVLKDIIDKQTIAQVLCSYFLKTVMFWVVEDTSSTYWIPQNILLCFRLCLRRLIKFIIDEDCPNYFVIGNNMFRERFNTSQKEVLLQVLCDIASNGWQWVLQTKTLARFPYLMTKQKLDINILENTVYKKEQLDIFKLVEFIIRHCREATYNMKSRVNPINKSFLSTVCKVPVVRQKTIAVLCHYIDTDNTNLGNKTLYALRELQVQLLTMESRDSIISGKILLASWLYTRGKYYESLQVTDAGLKNLDLCMFHEGKRIMQSYLFDNMLRVTRDFTEIFYLSSSDYVVPGRSLLVPREVLEMYEGKKKNQFDQYGVLVSGFCSRSYIYFLRFLCYFRLGDAQRYEHEYSQMKSVCSTYCLNMKNRHSANNFFLKLLCNKIRHNINFDVSDKFQFDRAVKEHWNELDFTMSEWFDLMRNVHEYLIQAPVHVIDNFFKD